MKRLHLICNAHLDPVWQWDWDEGAAAALATFYSAIDLAKDYDYIFCHNEVILYEYIEKYAPYLFDKIVELVKQGKWKIMGGWYDQPDCNLPSGESFIRQITLGRKYFKAKFDSEPTSALNFDSFGHTRGLPQILKKTGFDSYVFCRPLSFMLKFTDEPFLWEGYDGSRVKAIRINDDSIYCSSLGKAKSDIERKAKVFENQETGIALWGVGNHGGGASRKDLDDILILKKENEGKTEIIHSTLEKYFADVDPKFVYKKPFELFIKAYSSVNLIKRKHAELEDTLTRIEKACALASLKGFAYDHHAFDEASRMLCQLEFHDVLSGTCVGTGVNSSVRKVDYALELIDTEFLKAFHFLAKDYEPAKEGIDPIVIYSFQPYRYETVLETEIFRLTPLLDSEWVPVVTQDGKEIPSQVIKEEGNINIDRRKRIAYRPVLNPLGLSRVDVSFKEVKPRVRSTKAIEVKDDLIIKDKCKTVRISAKSGLLDSFIVNGKEYLSGGAFEPISFTDNQDPWGWNLKVLGKDYRSFKLMKKSKGPFAGLTPVHILEDGPVFTEVESLFELGGSYVKVSYKIYKDLPYVDVSCYILWNEQNKGLKFLVPAVNGAGKYFGQVAFGEEGYAKNGNENPSQRFVYVKENDSALAVYTNEVYGTSMKRKKLYMTALNGSAYCAHPVEQLPLVDDTRFIPYIEQGAHNFTFRLGVNRIEECERRAQEFAYKPYSVNMYPHGKGNIVKDVISLSNNEVTLSSFRKLMDGRYLVRLFNNSPRRVSTSLKIENISKEITLGKYSFETFVYDGKKITLSKRSDLY